MIPRAFVGAWRPHAPWPLDAQVEQDLVLSRALVELFQRPSLARKVALRGGTALYKLYFGPVRHSEDIDLVQCVSEPIGATLDEVRSVLDPWLGTPGRDRSDRGTTLKYQFPSEGAPPVTLRLKVEINTREHAPRFGYATRSVAVRSGWFEGEAELRTYDLDELLGTKLRALYQRRKGRDLFDLGHALAQEGVSPERVIDVFQYYVAGEGARIPRAAFEANLAAKRRQRSFIQDMSPLLPAGSGWDPDTFSARVCADLISRIVG